jgi:predicted membrane metal-binding protein
VATTDPLSSHRKVAPGSERAFGLVFAVVFALVGLFPLVHGGAVRWWALAVALAFVAAAYLAPRILRPFNRLWFHFGLLLHAVVNPVIMFVIYYGAVVPMGLVIRARGKDLLRLKHDKAAASYWIKREPPGSMTKQF